MENKFKVGDVVWVRATVTEAGNTPVIMVVDDDDNSYEFPVMPGSLAIAADATLTPPVAGPTKSTP